MPRPSFIDRVNAYLDGLGTNREYNETEIAGLALLRSQAPTSLKAVVYNPLLCLILQGEKETH
ncbi:MAG: AraC family transcriptional regulator N-terminal domain-containing protein, partial [Rhodothermales bacterium]